MVGGGGERGGLHGNNQTATLLGEMGPRLFVGWKETEGGRELLGLPIWGPSDWLEWNNQGISCHLFNNRVNFYELFLSAAINCYYC